MRDLSPRAHRGAATLAAPLLCILALAAIPGQAAAVERVADGNFEQTTCTAADCTSPAWTTTGLAPGGTLIGPLCGPQETDCTSNGFGGYSSATHWAMVGSGYQYPGGGDRVLIDSTIQQDVIIPAAPATLRYALFIHDSAFADEELNVSIDGQVVHTVFDENFCCTVYFQFAIPVGSHAGPGPKTLRFEGEGDVDPGLCVACATVESDMFQIDDVSLDAPDVPSSGTTPTTPSATAQASTGLRAAALAKCKKKRGKARKKCKKKANLLPV